MLCFVLSFLNFSIFKYAWNDADQLYCVVVCVGMALSAQGTREKVEEALEILQRAIDRGGNNAQLRFQKAHILMGLEEVELALQELLVVERIAPKEPPVHAMLAQAYHKLGMHHEALRHINTAIDLDPKEAAALKVSQILRLPDHPDPQNP